MKNEFNDHVWDERDPSPWLALYLDQSTPLPDDVKERLLGLSDSRITKTGVLVLKAQTHRTQEANRMDALQRLTDWVNSVAMPPKTRRATKPSYGSKQRTRAAKSQRSAIKSSRGPVDDG